MIRLACIANAVYLTVLLTQQAALLYDIGFCHGELETYKAWENSSAVDLPCSGSVELTRSCMCCVLRTTCFNARTLTATHTLTAYNEFISQTTALRI